jgi:SMC interacting uncharacterized protein involved in chromosome segregation
MEVRCREQYAKMEAIIQKSEDASGRLALVQEAIVKSEAALALVQAEVSKAEASLEANKAADQVLRESAAERLVAFQNVLNLLAHEPSKLQERTNRT